VRVTQICALVLVLGSGCAAALRRGPDPRVDLDDATDVSVALARARGYRLEHPPAFTDRFRTFTMAREGSVVRLVVQLHGGHHSSMRVDASTACLPRG
jgi:hypothetical protein